MSRPTNRPALLKEAADELRAWADKWQSEDCDSFMLLISDETVLSVRNTADLIEKDAA